MIIYFLRHASAGEKLSNPKKDEKRALDEDGHRAMRISWGAHWLRWMCRWTSSFPVR